MSEPSGILSKANSALYSVRTASCSTRWVQLVVHSIFFMITVVSFILIIILSIHRPLGNNKVPKCIVAECKVVCSQAPFLEDFEGHAIVAVKEANKKCRMVTLILNRPRFVNNMLPPYWLNGMENADIYHLQIIGGNLKQIAPNAFMTGYAKNIKILELEDVTLKLWEPNMFVGLTNLRDLIVKHSEINYISKNSLRSVETTLQTLKVKSCGIWDPANLTGSAAYDILVNVDLNSNNFQNILGPNSFSQLQKCRVLNLASANITAISPGAFDYMESIEVIYLTNNNLVTLPVGIFERIASLSLNLQIDLQSNPWNCVCNLEHIRILHAEGIIIADPLCNQPANLKYIYFSEIDSFCVNNSDFKLCLKSNLDRTFLIPKFNKVKHFETALSFEVNCDTPSDKHNIEDMEIVSPIPKYSCTKDDYKYLDTNIFSNITGRTNTIFTPTFYVNYFDYSMLQVNMIDTDYGGIIWFQTSCPKKIYCVSSIPSFFQIYNVDPSTWFTMCPTLPFGNISKERCIKFNPSDTVSLEKVNQISSFRKILFNMFCVVFGLSVGAFILYGLMRRNPALLRGSKRILLVKHKAADALVLPPSLPLRPDLLEAKSPNHIWITPSNNPFDKSCTIRSNKSCAPSYISALQPTEEQMKEWRLKNHFSKDLTTRSKKNSNVSLFSWVNDATGDDLQSFQDAEPGIQKPL